MVIRQERQAGRSRKGYLIEQEPTWVDIRDVPQSAMDVLRYLAYINKAVVLPVVHIYTDDAEGNMADLSRLPFADPSQKRVAVLNSSAIPLVEIEHCELKR